MSRTERLRIAPWSNHAHREIPGVMLQRLVPESSFLARVQVWFVLAFCLCWVGGEAIWLWTYGQSRAVNHANRLLRLKKWHKSLWYHTFDMFVESELISSICSANLLIRQLCGFLVLGMLFSV